MTRLICTTILVPIAMMGTQTPNVQTKQATHIAVNVADKLKEALTQYVTQIDVEGQTIIVHMDTENNKQFSGTVATAFTVVHSMGYTHERVGNKTLTLVPERFA